MIKAKNKKAQFFLAAAVIIIITLSLIFSYLNQVKSVDNPNIFAEDLGFTFSNLREEYGMTVQEALANVSWDSTLTSAQINTTLNGNLSLFENFTNNLTQYRGISINSSYDIYKVLNYTMNVSVNLKLTSPNSYINSSFDVVRALDVDIGGFYGTTPCEFNATVIKEYNEPITGMNGSNIELFGIDEVAKVTTNCDMNETTTPGIYNITCTDACESSAVVDFGIADHRNIYGNDTKAVP